MLAHNCESDASPCGRCVDSWRGLAWCVGPSVRVGPQSHVPTQESGHANRGQPHTHVGSHGIGNLDIHIRPRPTRHERPHTLRMATQQWRHNGRPRYTMGVHKIIGRPCERSSWVSTWSYGRPRSFGRPHIGVYSHEILWVPRWCVCTATRGT